MHDYYDSNLAQSVQGVKSERPELLGSGGQWPGARGQGAVASGQWSVVGAQWSGDSSQCSACGFTRRPPSSSFATGFGGQGARRRLLAVRAPPLWRAHDHAATWRACRRGRPNCCASLRSLSFSASRSTHPMLRPPSSLRRAPAAHRTVRCTRANPSATVRSGRVITANGARPKHQAFIRADASRARMDSPPPSRPLYPQSHPS